MDVTSIILIVIAIICLVIGLIGTVVPIIPGAPLAWIGILLGKFIPALNIPWWLVILTGLLAVGVSILDNIFPITMTKKFGGSKYGTWGCTIGLIAGIFAGPAAIIFFPFIGAFIGELIFDASEMNRVVKAAGGAFLGFLLGVGVKLISVLIFGWIFVYYLIH